MVDYLIKKQTIEKLTFFIIFIQNSDLNYFIIDILFSFFVSRFMK